MGSCRHCHPYDRLYGIKKKHEIMKEFYQVEVGGWGDGRERL